MNQILGLLLVAALAAGGWLWHDNRSLRGELARDRAARAPGADPWATPSSDDGSLADRALDATTTPGGIPAAAAAAAATPPFLRRSGARPELPEGSKESRLERRVRRREELASFLGREAGESDDEYRQRILPMLHFLDTPRATLDDQRRDAERIAGVSEEQRQRLDATFDDVYDELITYTNEAITSGELTPYQSNIAGILQYTGGLGAIMDSANQRIGSVLTPEQLASIYGTGFEWAEYLGVHAPWDRLTPPPPPGT